MSQPDHSHLSDSQLGQNNMSAQSALNEWKATRTLLINTIQSYRAASVTLGAVCTRASTHPLERAAAEEALLDLDSEIPSLSMHEETLHDTRISLLQLRNSSAKLTRINAFPPEVLTHILALSRTYCAYADGGKQCFNAVAEVNTQWRRIALSTPDMWTHIDIHIGASERSRYSLAKLLFERSKDALVHVHISEPGRFDPDEPTARLDIIRLANFLAPHFPRVHSLDLDTRTTSNHLISYILQQWLNIGPTAPKALYIHRTKVRDLLHPENGEQENVAPTRESGAQKALLHLRILHLQGAVFKWESPAYRGLVDLRLDAGSPFSSLTISMSQLANILTTSPKMGTLKLQRVLVNNPEEWTPPAPIVLDCLQTLNLVDLGPDSLNLVLPLIAQPNPSAQLSIGLTFDTGQLFDELEAFFSRCHVATLYRKADAQVLFLWEIPVRVPHLVISEFEVPESQSLLAKSAQEESLLSRPVRFHPITHATLVSCIFTIAGLARLVADHGIQSLRLDCCTMVEIPTKDEPMEGTLDVDLQAVLLLSACPGLDLIISDTDSTAQLPCRTMFDR
ncbi:hypothetical protein FRC08_011051 [Ceratobasidium sp. 394]|nr:hypothetical protein FRC08_011051 [Ceratobasidium sp. 394]